MKKLFVSCAVILATISNAKAAHTVAEDWASKLPVGACSHNRNAAIATRDMTLKSFDPRCLSNANCRVVLKVDFDRDGTPQITKLKGENCTSVDEFYCEQAVWDVMFPNPCESIVCEFNALPSKEFGEHPELLTEKKDTVRMHLTPLYFPFSKEMSPNIVFDKSNYVEMSVNNLSSPELLKFRKERIMTGPFSPERVVSMRTALKNKFDYLFGPGRGS
jgi:hypothetical protein